jgi:pimeloyl-ACP methyl ester carboxylesterase
MKTDFFKHQQLRLRYHDSQGSGLPLFCLHGNSSGADAFLDLFATLGQTYRLIAIDLPGHGESDRAADPAQQYTLAGFAEVLQTAIAHFGVARYGVIGHSLGGHAALEALPQLPGLQALILVAAPPFNATHIGSMFAPDPSGGRVFQAQLSSLDEVELGCAFVNRQAMDANRFDQALNLIHATDPALRASIGSSLSGGAFGDEAALLQHAAIPALLVLGSLDGFMQLEFCRNPERWFGGRNLQVAVMDGCAHNPHFEQPDAFAALAGKFLQQQF